MVKNASFQALNTADLTFYCLMKGTASTQKCRLAEGNPSSFYWFHLSLLTYSKIWRLDPAAVKGLSYQQ